jgi:outer membrane protein assembly factor BamB
VSNDASRATRASLYHASAMLSRLRPTLSRRWLAWAAGAAAVIAAGLVVALNSRGGGDVFNADVPFRLGSPPAIPRTPPAARREGRFTWAVFGFGKTRTRYLPTNKDLGPPYDQRWAFRGSVLLEFPPILGSHSVYLLRNNGSLYAFGRKTGRLHWKRKVGFLSASSPAYAHNTVFVTVLKRFKGSKGGRVVAIAADDGHTRWSRRLGSRTESSPLVDRGKVYFGTENGSVYALDAHDGSVLWRYRAGGAVKGGLTFDEGRRRLYFGDYGGSVHSIRSRNGQRVWHAKSRSGPLGLGRGAFYSTPAVAYGRVYIGSTNGNVYSYDEDTGRLAWRKRTGNYVYSSPAVAHVPRGRPTVYVGSYDGRLYALDARTGRVRWSRRAEGRISGSPVVIGGLVWYSTLAKTTAAVGARTGRRVYLTHRGAFNPAVSDGHSVYLVGYSSLFALQPRHTTRAEKRRALLAAERRRRAREENPFALAPLGITPAANWAFRPPLRINSLGRGFPTLLDEPSPRPRGSARSGRSKRTVRHRPRRAARRRGARARRHHRKR